MAYIYSMADIPEKEEEYYRQALRLEPENPVRMRNLAYFLIDKERDIDGGVDLINRAIAFSPDNYNSLFIKGWGLYKQHRYPEAFDLLQKSWDLRSQYSIYNHTAFLHFEEAKKAVTSQQ